MFFFFLFLLIMLCQVWNEMGEEVLNHIISFEIRPQHTVLPTRASGAQSTLGLRPRRVVLGNTIGQDFMKVEVLSTLPPFPPLPPFLLKQLM